MGKVLIIQSVLPQYRIPIFNMLAESCELTVLVPESPKDFSDINFKDGCISIKNYFDYLTMK